MCVGCRAYNNMAVIGYYVVNKEVDLIQLLCINIIIISNNNKKNSIFLLSVPLSGADWFFCVCTDMHLLQLRNAESVTLSGCQGQGSASRSMPSQLCCRFYECVNECVISWLLWMYFKYSGWVTTVRCSTHHIHFAWASDLSFSDFLCSLLCLRWQQLPQLVCIKSLRVLLLS